MRYAARRRDEPIEMIDPKGTIKTSSARPTERRTEGGRAIVIRTAEIELSPLDFAEFNRTAMPLPRGPALRIARALDAFDATDAKRGSLMFVEAAQNWLKYAGFSKSDEGFEDVQKEISLALAREAKQLPRNPEALAQSNVVKDILWGGYDRLKGKEIVETDDHSKVVYVNLLSEFRNQLEKHLISEGLGEAEAGALAGSVASEPGLAAKFTDAAALRAGVEGALAALRASGQLASTNEAKIELPKVAPAKWEDEDSRLPGETSVEFLRRVWGVYMDAGVLYQDDIKRLGDGKLIRAIRSYCQKHPDLNPADILPPPRQVRTERALAAAKPGSADEALLKERVRKRNSSGRGYRQPRPS
jgi:hypothetical protein